MSELSSLPRRPAETSDFANVGRAAWWQRGFFASQTAYVGLALVVVIVAMTLANPTFLSAGNVANVAKNFSFIAIATLGITLVIITGGIDLSVGAVMCLAAMVTSMTMQGLDQAGMALLPGLSMLLAVVAGLAAAAVVGLVNGVLIARVGLSPFVTTLGMLSIVRGLSYVVSNGRGSYPAGSDADLFYGLTSGDLFGIPAPFIYLVLLAGLMGFVLHHTAWGRYVFAVGGNEKAAELTGVPVARMKIAVYTLSALAAGFNGIVMSGWLGSAPANLADGYELNIIAAAVIGGANLAGGVGGPVGAVIGCVLIEVIRNGLVLANVNAYWQKALVGCIIILAVLVDKFRTRRAG
ncbi:ABC transporter permease [Chelatococcus sp. SYSU_G07232]|uniref:ABC transporter permease n=1 Tax=Chelatococcus albus TaxID=3047466 RepID=A0ABT7AJU9_9HYPH|nr:ABC transporter permease [Chelatococcus sp. SYSU_G07232]MDJ1159651.1 ABC transporter permease [Chelatococcus sp. SYSU_G07232]